MTDGEGSATRIRSFLRTKGRPVWLGPGHMVQVSERRLEDNNGEGHRGS